MNGARESRSPQSGCLHGIRLFVPAAITLVVGFTLYTWRPLWLAPPYHAYSPVLYFLLALGWIPFCAYGVWRFPKRRLLVTALGILLVPLTCVAGFIVSPHAYYELVHMRGEDHGSLEYGSLDEQHCSLQEQIFTCELAIGSSDNDMVILYSYRFRVINDLPIMWLTSFSSRHDCNPAYLSCARSSSP